MLSSTTAAVSTLCYWTEILGLALAVVQLEQLGLLKLRDVSAGP